MKIITLLLSGLIFFFFSCKNTNNQNTNTKKDSVAVIDAKKGEYKETDLTKNNALIIADSIAYPVIVKNPDQADEWTTDCLKHLNLKSLVNSIFNAVYEGKLTPYNYQTETPMTLDEVKQLEANYKRTEIGKILFTEEWYFDDKNMKMGKRVNSIMLAYELYDTNKSVKAYKAGVKVYLSDETKNKKKDIANK
jgi:hypothetical protein